MARNTSAPGGYIGGEPPRRPYFNQLSGVWKLEDVVERQKAGLWANPVGIEDLFSTWLYTGNGSTQTITNGIDLAGEGGLVWIKPRNIAEQHVLFDTERGAPKRLVTNAASAQANSDLSGFTSSGFTLTNIYGDTNNNFNSQTYASWTFRKAAKFFDVVTYTGNGTSGLTVSHNLGSVPGFIIIKNLDQTNAWNCWHRSIASPNANWWHNYLTLNTTNSAASWTTGLVSEPTSTTFEVGTGGGVNNSGINYVAYLFAHDAGGFGDSGNESVIKCGSFTADGSGNASIDLGWEPQWLLIKRSDGADNWRIIDSLRGWTTDGNISSLLPNSSTAETYQGGWWRLKQSGFAWEGGGGFPNQTFIYIAIRRGPMKTPTSGTEVFAALAASNGSTGTSRTVGFPADLSFTRWRSGTTAMQAVDRLRGMPTSSNANALLTSSTAAEGGYSPYAYDIWNTTAKDGANANLNDMVWHYFRRAPGFFDVVAYTGSSSQVVNHNLGVTPELWIIRGTDRTSRWFTGMPGVFSGRVYLNSDSAKESGGIISSFTSTTFTQVTGASEVVGPNIVYLFATCPGVSKVGSYTGTGTTLSIDCGFTNGARFVLIKRTDSTGDWYVWDTARGIVAGNDPYLLLNSTAAENTSTDYIDPLSSGFQISSTAPAAINANGGSFIFLAIA